MIKFEYVKRAYDCIVGSLEIMKNRTLKTYKVCHIIIRILGVYISVCLMRIRCCMAPDSHQTILT